MNIAFSDRAFSAVLGLPPNVRKVHKQLAYLEKNLLHPSLHAKKYSKSDDLWQARVNKDWRFYFTIEGGAYRIQGIVPHPK